MNQPMLYWQIEDSYTSDNIATLCGNYGPTIVRGHSNSVTLNFITDSSITFKGWSLTWAGKKQQQQMAEK